MKEKYLLLTFCTTLLLGQIKSLTYWFDVRASSRFVESAAVCGTNAEYIVQGEGSAYNVFTVNWVTGVATNAKTINLSGYSFIGGAGFMGGGDSPNFVIAVRQVVRISAVPGQSNGDQSYSMTSEVNYYAPLFQRGTSFLFLGSNEEAAGKYKLFRIQSDTTNGVEAFTLTGGKTRTYGILAGSTWLVASIDGTTTRMLFDYSNGYDGGNGTATSTHTKTDGSNSEVGFTSPDDKRGYYVVSSGAGKTLYTIKDSDGSEKLQHTLSTLTDAVEMIVWVYDTDLVLVSSFKHRFVIVDFMDEAKSTAPVYTALPNGSWKQRLGYVWEDKKALVVSGQ